MFMLATDNEDKHIWWPSQKFSHWLFWFYSFEYILEMQHKNLASSEETNVSD